MFKKALYVTGFLVFLVLLFFLYREYRPSLPFGRVGEQGQTIPKEALIRLEDISPGAYDTAEKLGKLEAIADFLHEEGVPFHVSLIPVYKDPRNNIEISIGDTQNAHVRAFIKTILYLREKGGLIGLHGYTHQYRNETTGNGYEFATKGTDPFAGAAYAEERINKALELADRAGIPVDYWETPHYTGSSEQYKVMGDYFGLLYEPNPKDKKNKFISSWDGSESQSVVFVPAPFLNVAAAKDVDRILNQLNKEEPAQLASFFFHPYQEFQFMYKMKAPEGYTFYAHETNSYLHRLIGGFKEKGYTFVSVYDAIEFLPAQRMSGLSPTSGKVLVTGDFDGDRRADFAAGDPSDGSWFVVKSRLEQALPRNNGHSFSPATEWLRQPWQGGTASFAAGDFNGDGRCDLVCWDRNTAAVRVALSDGGSFVPPQHPWGKFGAPDPDAAAQMLVADFNGDRIDDLFFWEQGENRAFVLTCNGKGFSPASPWLEHGSAGGSFAITAGDFNGDGKKDLAVLDKETGAVEAAFSTGSRFLKINSDGDGFLLKDFVSGYSWQVQAGDVNGDGIDELIAYNGADGKWLFAHVGETGFIVTSIPFTYGRDLDGRSFVADFNGDGKADLAVERRFARGQTPVDIAVSVLSAAKQRH